SKEVTAVLTAMGPIENDSGASAENTATEEKRSAAEKTSTGDRPRGSARRLYRIEEGAMGLGLCNGIAAYVDIDPTLVRLAFVFLTFFWGTGILAYLVMSVIVPAAKTAEEKSAAK